MSNGNILDGGLTEECNVNNNEKVSLLAYNFANKSQKHILVSLSKTMCSHARCPRVAMT
jgi:hypothetical protein